MESNNKQASETKKSPSPPDAAKQSSSTRANGELITWYLARLRNTARQSSLDRKLTPLTLVETDRTLIQEIVMRSHGGFEQRCQENLMELEKLNKGVHSSPKILLAMGILGSLYLMTLAFF
ncbi:MAG: hypothetical protein K2X81_01190 [Candidatus Obscuribacterales bacterium]|nr:hypothetical protein [Candidatus Obscuribacterales bacterium]